MVFTLLCHSTSRRSSLRCSVISGDLFFRRQTCLILSSVLPLLLQCSSDSAPPTSANKIGFNNLQTHLIPLTPQLSIQMMSKPTIVGSGGGAGTGPLGAAVAVAVQKQKALLQRADDDITHLVDNFNLLINISRICSSSNQGFLGFQTVLTFMFPPQVNELPIRNLQEAFRMEMQATRMVQAADSLLKLVSELKQMTIFSGFASLSENVDWRIVGFEKQVESMERLLQRIGEQAAASLKELEMHYYLSVITTGENEGG